MSNLVIHAYVPNECSHHSTTPIYAYVHPANPRPGDTALVANDGTPVGATCDTCGAWATAERTADPEPLTIVDNLGGQP